MKGIIISKLNTSWNLPLLSYMSDNFICQKSLTIDPKIQHKKMTASTTVLICLLSYLFLSFFFTYNYAADQIYYSNRPTSQMTKPFVYQLASGAPVALSIKYFDDTGDYDNVYHFIPDNPSAKSNFTMRFYVDGFSNIAWSALLTSLVSGWNSVSKCGVLVKSSLSSSRESTTSQNSTFFNTPLSISNSDKFNCVVSANLEWVIFSLASLLLFLAGVHVRNVIIQRVRFDTLIRRALLAVFDQSATTPLRYFIKFASWFAFLNVYCFALNYPIKHY